LPALNASYAPTSFGVALQDHLSPADRQAVKLGLWAVGRCCSAKAMPNTGPDSVRRL
jgi:hypothetical protein